METIDSVIEEIQAELQRLEASSTGLARQVYACFLESVPDEVVYISELLENGDDNE